MHHNEPTDPAHRANWLPTPDGTFRPLLRMYEPDDPIFDGTDELPPITASDRTTQASPVARVDLTINCRLARDAVPSPSLLAAFGGAHEGEFAIQGGQPQFGADDMHPQTINAFDPIGCVFSELEPTLIVGQEQRVAATAGSRRQAGVWR